MGQVPPKYFMPSAPYGASPATNVVNPTQPGARNPQTPLLPPNFQDPGAMQSATPAASSTTAQLQKPNNIWWDLMGFKG